MSSEESSSSSSKGIIISKGRNKNDVGSSIMNNISSATTTTTTLDGNANNPTTITIDSSSNSNLLPRILVIYFPQFHPDPLNDKNWGVNFTDWVSLRGSPEKNRFGYDIPRPTELGYYDLRDTEIRRKQGQLAKQYGIDGFIYHTYWFYDTTHPGPNLAAPLLKMLHDGQPDIPFLFNWCISRWTNVWMGKAIFQKIPTSMNRMLILQEQYFNVTDEMIHEHYNWLSQFFHHRNYIKINNNKPAYLIYYYDERVLPIMDKLNKYAKQDGFINGIHWIVGRSAAPNDIYVPQGLDERLTKIMSKKTQNLDLIQMDKFDQSMTYPYALEYVTRQYEIPSWCRRNHNNNNGTSSSSSSSPPPPPTSVSGSNNNNKAHPEITGIMTSFDNTPRRQYDSAYVYRPDVPEKILERFHNNLYVAMHYHKCCLIEGQAEKEKENHNYDDDDSNDHFVTINAWNEWAEGMSIEPSTVYGRRFLEAIRNVKQQLQKVGCSSSVVPKFEFNSTR